MGALFIAAYLSVGVALMAFIEEERPLWAVAGAWTWPFWIAMALSSAYWRARAYRALARWRGVR